MKMLRVAVLYIALVLKLGCRPSVDHCSPNRLSNHIKVLSPGVVVMSIKSVVVVATGVVVEPSGVVVVSIKTVVVGVVVESFGLDFLQAASKSRS